MIYKKYFEIGIGDSPIILSCPHGGFKVPRNLPDKLKGVQIPDESTYFIAKMMINHIRKNNVNVFYILNKIHRCKVDLNRPPRSQMAFNQDSSEARSIHHIYHDHLIRFTQNCISNFDRCLLIDFHGFTKPDIEYPDVIFGHIFGKSLSLTQDLEKQDCSRYWGCFQLNKEIAKDFTIDDGLALSDFNLSYSGGYITHQFYNKEKVNAIQIEISKDIRLNPLKIRRFIRVFSKAIIETLND